MRPITKLLQAGIVFSLAWIALGLLFAWLQVISVSAGTISVDGTTCTLIDAILAANTDTAVGGCAAGSGTDVLNLTASQYLLTSPYGSTNYGLPPVTSTLVIQGNGAIIERDVSATSFGIFQVLSSGNLTLINLTVRNGSDYGGIDVNGGTLNLSHTQVISNSGFNGGGIGGYGTLLVASSLISGNVATNMGGGIDFQETMEITNSMVLSNSGGGILFAHPVKPARIVGSTIAYNTYGGVVGGYNGVIQLYNSTVSFNDVGVSLSGFDGSTAVAITHTTIVSNTTAGVSDGGFCSDCVFTYTSSILAGNGIAPTLDCDVTSASLSSGGYNVLGSDCAYVSTDITDTLPAVGALQFNGGSTWTQALLSGSPAIERVPPNTNGCKTSITIDQRGAVRADGTNRGGSGCDSGAYEGDSNQTPTALKLLKMVNRNQGAPPWRQGIGILLLILTVWLTRWAVRSNVVCGCAK